MISKSMVRVRWVGVGGLLPAPARSGDGHPSCQLAVSLISISWYSCSRYSTGRCLKGDSSLSNSAAFTGSLIQNAGPHCFFDGSHNARFSFMAFPFSLLSPVLFCWKYGRDWGKDEGREKEWITVQLMLSEAQHLLRLCCCFNGVYTRRSYGVQRDLSIRSRWRYLIKPASVCLGSTVLVMKHNGNAFVCALIWIYFEVKKIININSEIGIGMKIIENVMDGV